MTKIYKRTLVIGGVVALTLSTTFGLVPNDQCTPKSFHTQEACTNCAKLAKEEEVKKASKFNDGVLRQAMLEDAFGIFEDRLKACKTHFTKAPEKKPGSPLLNLFKSKREG